jgi:hypothetical protein
MVRVFLIVQMPDASDKGNVTFRFRPIDRFFLSFKSTGHMVRMVFHYIILNGFKAALRTGFNVNVRHSLLSPHIVVGIEITRYTDVPQLLRRHNTRFTVTLAIHRHDDWPKMIPGISWCVAAVSLAWRKRLAHAREGKDQAQIGQHKAADERFIRLD